MDRLDDVMKGYLPFLTCMIPYNGGKKKGVMKMVSGYQVNWCSKFRTLLGHRPIKSKKKLFSSGHLKDKAAS